MFSCLQGLTVMKNVMKNLTDLRTRLSQRSTRLLVETSPEQAPGRLSASAVSTIAVLLLSTLV